MTSRGVPSAGAACPACGVGTPAGARFCPACGQRLGGGVGERRVVTVLFADLVDSTSLVASLDPEAARDLLNETFRGRATEADATAMGALALVRRLARHEGDGR